MAVELMDLPQEIIELFLSYLTHINDLLRTAQVCRKFYQISRRQLKPIGKLIVYRTRTGTCPIIECFQNVEIFPFSSLYMPNWSNTRFDLDPVFWTRFGDQIHTATINCNRADLINLVGELKRYFPNLRSLTVNNPDYDETSCANNSVGVCNLPIEELRFDSDNADVHDVMYLLRCSARLRKLFLSIDCEWSNFSPFLALLPYFEAIEAVEIHTTMKNSEWNLESLPSKIVFTSVSIEDDEPIEEIRQFFSTKRTIKWLYLTLKSTLQQIMTISRAISVEEIHLGRGLPNFAGCLDVLAEMPGVKKISLDAEFHDQEELEIDALYPFYWSNQKSLNKITEFCIEPSDIDRFVRYLTDFSQITRITFLNYLEPKIPLFDKDMQLILQHFPKLEYFEIKKTKLTDAGLLGNGTEGQKSISCLENLKLLDFGKSPGITTASFEAFKFPKLEIFKISNSRISNVALALLALNAPNLKEIELKKSALDKEGLEFAIKKLPKLRKITFNGANMTDAMINSIKRRFSYVKIIRRVILRKFSVPLG